MQKFGSLLITVMVFLMTSCDSDDIDNTPPRIDFVSIEPTPESMEVCGELDPLAISIFGGETLRLQTLITDDVALSQLKADIHPNFDCHGHRTLSTSDWLVLELVDLEGREQNLLLEFDLPEMVTVGFYHMQVRVVDRAGNSTPTTDFWNLYVKNPHDTLPPELTILDFGQLPTVLKRGENLSFQVEVHDNMPLDFGGNARLELNYRRTTSDNLFNAVDIDLSTSEKIILTDVAFTIPQTLVAGDYLFTLTAFDGVNNLSEPIRMEVAIE